MKKFVIVLVMVISAACVIKIKAALFKKTGVPASGVATSVVVKEQQAPKDLTTAQANQLKVDIKKVHDSIVRMALQRKYQEDATDFLDSVDEFVKEIIDELGNTARTVTIMQLPSKIPSVSAKGEETVSGAIGSFPPPPLLPEQVKRKTTSSIPLPPLPPMEKK